MQQQPKTDHQENDADFDLDAGADVIGADVIDEAGGEVKVEKAGKRTGRSQRKVRFNDCSLTQVLEFQPSSRDDAVSLCAQLCTWLCGQSAERNR